MAKKKTPIKQNKNFLIILLSLVVIILISCTISLNNENAQLKSLAQNNKLESDITVNNKMSTEEAIDLVLSQKDAKKVFCNNANSHIKISGDFGESWQVRITQWTKSDEFGLKEYRVDKSTEQVTENPY